jgi:predicted nucleotidyltransferase
MVIHRAYDEVLRSWSHVAVLRALLDTTSGFTGNQVARVSGMHPLSALKALSSLEELGIVRRQRGGRDHLFTLNRDHYLVKEGLLSLYEAERRFPLAVEESLSSALKGSVVSTIIFGSVVRKQETPQSDLDLCCIVKSEAQRKSVRESLASKAAGIYRRFGVKIAPVIFSVAEFRKRSQSQLVKQLIKEGKVIAGKNPQELLRG